MKLPGSNALAVSRLSPLRSQTFHIGSVSLVGVRSPLIELEACGYFGLGREAPSMHTRRDKRYTSPMRSTLDNRVPAIGRHLSLVTAHRVLFGFGYHLQNPRPRRMPLCSLMHINAKVCSVDGKRYGLTLALPQPATP
jgi:hypothetical protein